MIAWRCRWVRLSRWRRPFPPRWTNSPCGHSGRSWNAPAGAQASCLPPLPAHSVAVTPAITLAAEGARLLAGIAPLEHLELAGVLEACRGSRAAPAVPLWRWWNEVGTLRRPRPVEGKPRRRAAPGWWRHSGRRQSSARHGGRLAGASGDLPAQRHRLDPDPEGRPALPVGDALPAQQVEGLRVGMAEGVAASDADDREFPGDLGDPGRGRRRCDCRGGPPSTAGGRPRLAGRRGRGGPVPEGTGRRP